MSNRPARKVRLNDGHRQKTEIGFPQDESEDTVGYVILAIVMLILFALITTGGIRFG